MNRFFANLVRTLMSAVCIWCCVVTSITAAEKPNVVLIMVDDLGYHDLGCYGHEKIKTPNLDGLAKRGVRLTSFYAGATVCTPSRMALLTGSYPARLGWTKGVIGHIMPRGSGLAPAARTIAEVFKGAGYATGLAGKWHLGDERPFRPHRQGFESAYYINKSNNQTNEIWRNDESVEKPFDNRLLTEKFAAEAIRFIKEVDQPFLLYLPFSAPHFPVQSHPDWKGKSSFGKYGDVVEELDSRIGAIVAVLKETGAYENTIIVFLSDNGPEPNEQAQAKPYRGLKWSALEGGTRVPCIFHWPGKLPADRTCDDLIAAIDIMPTLCSACGIELDLEVGVPIDGVDVLSALDGSASQPPRQDLLYWHGRDGCQAIRAGQWKLFFAGKSAGLKGGDADAPALFDLSTDPAESREVHAEHPDVVMRLQTLAEKRLADVQKGAIKLGQVEGGEGEAPSEPSALE